jgi:hypothetical protein
MFALCSRDVGSAALSATPTCEEPGPYIVNCPSCDFREVRRFAEDSAAGSGQQSPQANDRFCGSSLGAVRRTFGYETPFISLRDACQRITEALEAQDWPAKPNASFIALRQVQSTLVECDSAGFLLDRMENKANQNPIFTPPVLQAGRVLDNAKRRLERAHGSKNYRRNRPNLAPMGRRRDNWS